MQAAHGRWPEILRGFGLDESYLDSKGKGSACPICRDGTDRFTFDDRAGNGDWVCRRCERGAGDGLHLLSSVHGWSLPQAIFEVGRSLGLDVAPPSDHAAGPVRTIPPPKPKAPKRPRSKTVQPIPADAPLPPDTFKDKGNVSQRWIYRNAQGRPLFHVCRFDYEDGGEFKKDTIPQAWCTDRHTWAEPFEPIDDGWEWLSVDAPRPLYGLDRLAKLPGAVVLLVEGEKCADAAHRALGKTIACVSWPGGTNAWRRVDWSPLNGRKVILWPDNDLPGKLCMFGSIDLGTGEMKHGLAFKLEKLGARIAFVHPPQDKAPGWDVADALEFDHWSPAHLTEWLNESKSHDLNDNVLVEIGQAIPPGPVLEPPPDLAPDDYAAPQGIYEAPDEPSGPDHEESEPPTPRISSFDNNEFFRLLGFDHGIYFILIKRAQQVREFNARQLGSATGAAELMPLHEWQRVPRYVTDKGQLKYGVIASELIDASMQVGVYEPDRERGRRGAWMDLGAHVFHLGNRLWVDGEVKALAEHDSYFVYNAGPRLEGPAKSGLDDETRGSLIHAIDLIRWERPASAPLLLGWMVLAPICGMLHWRPHIWLTGAQGTGKSWIFENLISPLVGEAGLYCEGGTTSAGIRQSIRRDARPVVYDEAEPSGPREQALVDEVVTLARSASSESNRQTIKGTAGHEAMAFHVRSMFAFGSITPHVDRAQDISRITLLSLRPAGLGADHWKELEIAAGRIGIGTGRELLALVLDNIADVLANVDLFRKVAAESLGGGSQRIGDQFGTLLGAAWWLQNLGRATEADALEFCEKWDWAEHVSPSQDKDEERLLTHILQQVIAVDGNHKPEKATLGELVRVVATPAEEGELKINIDYRVAKRHLGRFGIRVMPDVIWFSNRAPALAKILSGTPWPTNWRQVLKRLPGAESANSGKTCWFSDGLVTKATAVPVGLVTDGCEADEPF